MKSVKRLRSVQGATLESAARSSKQPTVKKALEKASKQFAKKQSNKAALRETGKNFAKVSGAAVAGVYGTAVARDRMAKASANKKKATPKKNLKKANDGIIIKADKPVKTTSTEGVQLAQNLQNRKNAITNLIGTKTPDGRVVTPGNAEQVYNLMQAKGTASRKKGGPVKRKK